MQQLLLYQIVFLVIAVIAVALIFKRFKMIKHPYLHLCYGHSYGYF